MKRTAALLLSVLMITFCLCSFGKKTETTNTDSTTPGEPVIKTSASAEEKAEAYGIHHVEMTVKDYGTIKLELDGDTAPITVENFVTLIKDGFYDGLTFHRIRAGFMAQGGAPEGNGTGGSGKNIKGEFSANGVENNISHKRGVISMARASYSMDSASSQFFICHADSDFLDGQYAAFGHVTEGMDVIDKSCTDAKPIDNNGTIKADEQPVIETIKVID